MKNILVTGGPVHAFLDEVKIISNTLRGGLMAELAAMMEGMFNFPRQTAQVIYLTSKFSKIPPDIQDLDSEIKIVYHEGIFDYKKKVLQYAPTMDVIILGAAVANLIPKQKINGKFPSHNYKVGDTIPLEFTIAPRIIDEVKKEAPYALLFGFKLLSDAPYAELIRAAYGVLLESKAVTVFANDKKDLDQVYAVTKDRGVHPMKRIDIPKWIKARMEENYYSTVFEKLGFSVNGSKISKFRRLIKENSRMFEVSPEGHIFGTIAMRLKNDSFITTVRGKKNFNDISIVKGVQHHHKEVKIAEGYPKATLNAPLLSYVFSDPYVDTILHFHHQKNDLPTRQYATPGTDKDILSCDFYHKSFNIEGHGCILSYDKKGKLVT